MNMPLAGLPELIERLRQTQPVRTEQELTNWHWRHEVLPHLRASQLPPRFWFIATKWKREQKKAFDATRALLLKKGATIALVGERGMGKTTIAAQLIIERAMTEVMLPWHRRPPYRKLSKLIALFKSIYADFGSIETESLLGRHDSLCKDHPLLVIDELHDCEDQRIKNRLLTDTIDKRYANLVDTILISNQTPEQFMETTSDSVLSRIKEHGRIIHCTWESWR
jgi:DNA replication protein DnaC